MTIMAGDAFNIEITLKDASGNMIDTAQDVEVALGSLIKSLVDGGVSYDSDKKAWIFPVSQEESFAMPSINGLQARVKFSNTNVVGVNIDTVYKIGSSSAEVL